MINLRKTLAAVALATGGFLSFQTALGPGLAAGLRARISPRYKFMERPRRDQGIDKRSQEDIDRAWSHPLLPRGSHEGDEIEPHGHLPHGHLPHGQHHCEVSLVEDCER
jgi:hypothetical protein